MSWLYWLSAVATGLLLVYLVIAMLKPEWFE
jgi:K+-transporting ATPase KdpF subunit